MIQFAVGPLGLTHDEFWALTPREYEELCIGYREREKAQWDKLAWLSAQIYNLYRKKGTKAFTAKDFIDWDKIKTTPKHFSKADKIRTLQELDEELGL